MTASVTYTYDGTEQGDIRAMLSGMEGLVPARRGDPVLLTDEGERTRRLFEHVMGLPPDKLSGIVPSSRGLAGGITDIFTELTGEDDSCCAIVLRWSNDGFEEAEHVCKAFNRLLVRIFGSTCIDKMSFWYVRS